MSLSDILTSEEFLSSIARGLQKSPNYEEIPWERLYDDITHGQAIAIRDNKLEEFINNLF